MGLKKFWFDRRGRWRFCGRELDRMEVLRSGEWELIKSNNYRLVYRIVSSDGVFYLKHHFRMPWIKRVFTTLGLFSSRSRREWNMALFLRRLGVETANPRMYGERWIWGIFRESLLLLEGLEARSIRELGDQEWEWILRKIAYLFFVLHRHNLYYRDGHLDNFLIVSGEVYLIDIHAAFILPILPAYLRRRSLEKFAHSLYEKGLGRYLSYFCRCYYTLDRGISSSAFRLERDLEARVSVLERRRLSSRTKRIFRNSSEFAYISYRGGKLYYNRSYSLERIYSVLEGEGGGVGGIELERYRALRWWERGFRRSPAYLRWVYNRRFSLEGVPVLPAVAYFTGDYEAYLWHRPSHFVDWEEVGGGLG
ncbi:MAG: hypothetical protein D6805_09560, partial [Planctomycetota bacterium]